MRGNRLDNRVRREFLLARVHLDFHERPRRSRHEFVSRRPFLQRDEAKALFFARFAKINPLNAAGIDDGRLTVRIQVLMPVNMPQRDVIERRIAQNASHNHRIAADDCGTLRAGIDGIGGGEMR